MHIYLWSLDFWCPQPQRLQTAYSQLHGVRICIYVLFCPIAPHKCFVLNVILLAWSNFETSGKLCAVSASVESIMRIFLVSLLGEPLLSVEQTMRICRRWSIINNQRVIYHWSEHICVCVFYPAVNGNENSLPVLAVAWARCMRTIT